jgi:hypothetical protein
LVGFSVCTTGFDYGSAVDATGQHDVGGIITIWDDDGRLLPQCLTQAL